MRATCSAHENDADINNNSKVPVSKQNAMKESREV